MWRERALRAEAEVRALRETVGELLDSQDVSWGHGYARGYQDAMANMRAMV
jgi:hypothetical protein